MEIKSFVYITEENVDGCGDSASDLYGIDHEFTGGEKAALTGALEDIKAKARETDSCLSTGEMIEEAMNATFGLGHWKLVPYSEVFF